MISYGQRRDVVDRKVVYSKTEIRGALPERFIIKVPINYLIVKTQSVSCIQNAGQGRVVTDHHLNGSDHEQ